MKSPEIPVFKWASGVFLYIDQEKDAHIYID